MDSLPLNFALMGNWRNWVRIMLMVIIGGIALSLLTDLNSIKRTNHNGK